MKAYIAVAVAAIVGTLMLVAGVVGAVHLMTQTQHSENYIALQEEWDNNTTEDDKITICSAYSIMPSTMVDTMVEGSIEFDHRLTRDEAKEFLDDNCS